jgi:hypothetical protein
MSMGPPGRQSLWDTVALIPRARRLGVTRQSIIKLWIAERLESGRTAA